VPVSSSGNKNTNPINNLKPPELAVSSHVDGSPSSVLSPGTNSSRRLSASAVIPSSSGASAGPANSKSAISQSSPGLKHRQGFIPARSVSPLATAAVPANVRRPSVPLLASSTKGRQSPLLGGGRSNQMLFGRQSPLLMTKFPRQKKKSSSKSFKAPIPRSGLEIDVSDTSSSRNTESDVSSLLSPKSLPSVGDNDDDSISIDCCSEVTIKSPSPQPVDEADGSEYYETPIQNFDELLVQKRSNLSASNPAINNMSSTLPRQFPLTRTKSITRSLVPAMRRMFEKSRSCDPESKLRLTLPPTASARIEKDSVHRAIRGQPVQAISASNILNAGTESARSSFMLYEPAVAGTIQHRHSTDYLGDGGGGNGDGADDEEDKDHQHGKGFVKKCVSKVKSFIG